MDLVNQLLFAIVISSVTSTLLLMVWRLLRWYFMIANPKLVSFAFRIVCATYLLPIEYMTIILMKKSWLKGQIHSWKLYFARTKYITWMIWAIISIWFISALICVLIYFVKNRAWSRKLEDNIPIENELASDVFSNICRKLSIRKGEVSLQRNPLVESPMITALHKPQVLLPEQEYTEEELELIFYHELSHYKHHDLKWNVIVIIITLLQCFNPFIFLLSSIIDFWNECMADISALELSGKAHYSKQYFTKIESIMPESSERNNNKNIFLLSQLSHKVLGRKIP